MTLIAMHEKSSLKILVLSGLIGLAAARSHGDGFRNPPPGATGLGRAGAVQAQIDDASALTFNPANLTLLNGQELEAALSVARTKTTFTSPAGQKVESDDAWQTLPNLYYATFSPDRNFGGGIAITTPYGQSAEWDKDTPFQYQAPYSASMMLVNFNPTVAFKLTDTLAFGLGVDVYTSSLEFKQSYPWAMITESAVPDGEARVDADGYGWGGNAGLNWQCAPGHRLALTYRSPVTVEYDGDFEVTRSPFLPAGGTYQSDMSTEIEFPDIVGAAYGVALSETLRVEADVEWLGWSRYDALDLDIDDDGGLLREHSLAADWNDTWTYGLSMAWDTAENWTLRAGYSYIETPIPDHTFSPILPDADRHVFAVGAGYRKGRHAVDAAVTYNLYEDRTIASNPNPGLNGKYEFESDLFSLSYRYLF